MEVNKLFMTYNYNTDDTEDMSIAKNYVGRECLHFISFRHLQRQSKKKNAKHFIYLIL